MSTPTDTPATESGGNFIRDIIDADLRTGKHQTVVTRFPPEPNGYLHIGHAKSICLNFGLARDYQGRCHLRFDDTNPLTEDTEYTVSIQNDVRWLGFDWGEHLYHASDYFEQMYEYAVGLIKAGKAYVDSLSQEEMREYRGTLTEPGRPSPDRDRSVDENLALFERMRRGEFADGSYTLRARIDLASPNMKMRDPALYRIRKAHHHRTGDAWCIYPMYDFAHCLSDAIEGVTHSLCTLEFENNRELYDWIIREVDTPARPEQTEFARLALTYTVMSKRKLLQLVKEGTVRGWDDPRMPTIAGLRRRGYTPEAIRDFCDRIGVSKNNSTVDVGLLEYSIRQDLEPRAPRVMCVLDPIKVVLTNFPDGETETLSAPLFPPESGASEKRPVPFGRELYIDRDDFMEEPPEGYHRLAPGREVRLRYAYFITCQEVIKDPSGKVVELRCTYDPDTRGGSAPDGRKVKGTLHWVSATYARPVTVRLYDRLFTVERPDNDPSGQDFKAFLNPESLVTVTGAMLEPHVARAKAGQRFQFERHGYFIVDPDTTEDTLVFNRTVSLKDTWAKVSGAADPASEREAARRRRAEARRQVAATTTPSAVDPRHPERAAAFEAKYALNSEEARLLTDDLALAAFYEKAVDTGAPPAQVAKWVVNELLRELKGRQVSELAFGGEALGRLVSMIEAERITMTAGKAVFDELMLKGGSPETIVAERGLEQVSDTGAIESVVSQVLAQNPSELERYRGGEKKLFGFFMGLVMREMRGTGDPAAVRKVLQGALG